MNIVNVNARYPGATHDSFILKSSMPYTHLVNEHERYLDTQLWLIGDSGYPLQPWLLTPIRNPRTEVQRNFNSIHSSVRNKLERCIGIFKNRFRCLIHEQKLRYTHQKSSNIINSCVVFHNLLNQREGCEQRWENIDPLNANVNDYQNRNYLDEGRLVRNNLMQQMYNDIT